MQTAAALAETDALNERAAAAAAKGKQTAPGEGQEGQLTAVDGEKSEEKEKEEPLTVVIKPEHIRAVVRTSRGFKEFMQGVRERQQQL